MLLEVEMENRHYMSTGSTLVRTSFGHVIMVD